MIDAPARRVGTPGPAAASSAPPRTATPAPRVRRYGIRGVGVFYPSIDAAQAAASSLGLSDAHIMVSSNMEKLEAWMMNMPFDGAL